MVLCDSCIVIYESQFNLKGRWRMKKWYEGLEAKEIVIEISLRYHNTIASAIQKSPNIDEDYDEFNNKYNEIVPVIVQMKSAYYEHRNDNGIYHKWEKALNDIKSIKRSLDHELAEIIQTQKEKPLKTD